MFAWVQTVLSNEKIKMNFYQIAKNDTDSGFKRNKTNEGNVDL